MTKGHNQTMTTLSQWKIRYAEPLKGGDLTNEQADALVLDALASLGRITELTDRDRLRQALGLLLKWESGRCGHLLNVR